MKIYFNPQPNLFPQKGGVRTHLEGLYNQLSNLVELVSTPEQADILHVESAYSIPDIDKLSLYVCHGGFAPVPLSVVLSNLQKATKVVSVSKWIVDEYFPHFESKTIVIPNGVNLEDFQSQLKQMKKLGSLEQIIAMLPGMGQLKQLKKLKPEEKELAKIEAMINSMTKAERQNYKIINGSRRKRIAMGSGTKVQDVNRLLKNFAQTKKMMETFSKRGLQGMPPMFR